MERVVIPRVGQFVRILYPELSGGSERVEYRRLVPLCGGPNDASIVVAGAAQSGLWLCGLMEGRSVPDSEHPVMGI